MWPLLKNPPGASAAQRRGRQPRTTSRRSVDAARVAALSAGCADFEEEWEFLNKKLKALTLFAGVPALGEVEAALASAEAA